ncbi:unnamed protein product, partial [Effrenium voratum]
MGILGNFLEEEELRKPPPVTYGLEPFTFDPGPQPSQEELAREAERRVRSDKRFREALRGQKAAITALLQGCLEKVNGQLERGEEICQKAHFPLLNPRSFADLGAFAGHDHFTVDLRVDQVDEALQKLVNSLFGIVWTTVSVENETRAKSLDRFNKALQERMETLEHHLQDRSRQLSNCRYAYFLEITHLRNQLYMSQSDEDFEPVEAYFFDPTEYLEEELRQQLNDKITLSVKVYKDRLTEMARKLADLELQLETAKALSERDGNLDGYLVYACNKHGSKGVVESLAQLAPKEMQQWAQSLPPPPPSAVEVAEAESRSKSLEQMRQTMLQAAQEAEEERRLRQQAEQEQERLRAELAEVRRQLEQLEQRPPPGPAPPREVAPPQARHGPTTAEMDELRKELAKAKLLLEKERSRAAGAAAEAARLGELEEQRAAREKAEKVKLEDYDQTKVVLVEAAKETAVQAVATDTGQNSLADTAENVVTALKQTSDELESLRSFSKSPDAFSRQSSKRNLSKKSTRVWGEDDSDDFGNREAQTNITAHGGSFYLLEPPETEMEIAVKAELKELQECADSAFDSELGAIRKCLPGTCSRGAFLRLFQGVRSRLARYGALEEMMNAMRRAELEQVLEGVHFLMESDRPDEEVGLRDSIFGKGITKVMLDETPPWDFSALVKRWSGHCARILGHLVKSHDPVKLEAHPGRRIFIPLPGLVPSHDGGTGGGLQARQKKDFSPTRAKLYDFNFADGETRPPRGRKLSSRSPPRALHSPRSPPRSPSCSPTQGSPRAGSRSASPMAVEGQALQPFAADGSPTTLARRFLQERRARLEWQQSSGPTGLEEELQG